MVLKIFNIYWIHGLNKARESSAVLGLSCGTQDLRFLLWHVESSSLTSSLTSSLMETRLPALRVRSLGHQGSPYQASFKGEEMDTKKLRDLFKVTVHLQSRMLGLFHVTGSYRRIMQPWLRATPCWCLSSAGQIHKRKSGAHLSPPSELLWLRSKLRHLLLTAPCIALSLLGKLWLRIPELRIRYFLLVKSI